MTQDGAFSSLFLKVALEMLTWLENPAVEAGPLKSLLKSFAGQYSHKHRLNDGEPRPSHEDLMLKIRSCNDTRIHTEKFRYGSNGWMHKIIVKKNAVT